MIIESLNKRSTELL